MYGTLQLPKKNLPPPQKVKKCKIRENMEAEEMYPPQACTLHWCDWSLRCSFLCANHLQYPNLARTTLARTT